MLLKNKPQYKEEEKQKVYHEIQEVIHTYGVKYIISFEKEFPCSCVDRSFIVPFIAESEKARINPDEGNRQSAPYNDVYHMRFDTFSKFWNDWNKFKRILKIRHFS